MKFSKEKTDVLKYLEAEVLFRERVNKNRGLGNIAIRNHPCLRDVPKEVMTEIVEEILAGDRAWRWWLEDKNRPDLRGKDYFKGLKSKEQIEQEAQIDLDYEPGYSKLSSLHKQI